MERPFFGGFPNRIVVVDLLTWMSLWIFMLPANQHPVGGEHGIGGNMLCYVIAWNTLLSKITDSLKFNFAWNTLLHEIPYCLK